MPGKRINELPALSGAGSANDDSVLIFDTSLGVTKRILRSQLAEGMVPDLPLQYYLGVRTSNPTLRLNGDALQLGDYYLDSVTKYTTVYNGSGWNSYASVIAAQAAAEAARDAAQLAETNAESARDAAVIAKNAAELAETNAETAETNAETAETNAEAAQVAAETARDAAFVNANVYADTAAGLAATTTGDQFQVVVGDEIIRYSHDAGPVATEIARYPSASSSLVAADARFSYIPQKATDVAGAGQVEWVPRSLLTDTPQIGLEMQTAGNRQMLISNFTNPTIRISTSVVSSKLRVTSNLAAVFTTGAATGYTTLSGRTVSGGGKIVTLAGTLANAGFGPIFSAAAPTLGGTTAVMDADAEFVVLRANGALLVYGRDGTTVSSAVTVTPSVVSTPWSLGQVVTWVYKPTSATGGALSFYADGALLQTVTVAGLMADAYVMNGIRWAGTDTVELSDMRLVESSSDTVKRIYLNPSSSATPNGTESNPFLTLADAVESASIDAYRRELDIVLKAGVYRGTLNFDADQWRKIRIRSAKGQGTIIRPSSALASGGAAWTQIGASEVWYANHVWGGVTNSLLGVGGVVEVTSGVTQAFGRTGLVTISGRALYTRRNVGTSDASLARGDYTVHQSGTYAGKVLVRCYDGGDPNTKDWEQMAYRYGISCIGSANTAWNATDLILQDLTIEHPQTYGIWGRYINAVAENVAVKGTGESFGWEFDECNLRAYGCRAEGTYADGFHSAGGLSADANRRLPLHTYWDCDALGAFTSSLGGVGDGWSNHVDHIYNLYNCRAWSAGKDGLSAIGPFRATDFDARDNVGSGIVLAPGANKTLELSRVSGGKMIGNNTGVNLNFGAGNNTSASIDADRVHFENNVRSSVETFSSGTGCSGELNARNCTTRTTGAAPTEGHIKQAGLTINVVTGVALA